MKVNYLKEYGTDGTVYNQTITIEKEYLDKFNEIVNNEKIEINKKFLLSSYDMKILSYLENLKEGKNYVTLTTLDYFIKFYRKFIYIPIKDDKNFQRILWRNTVIKVV